VVWAGLHRRRNLAAEPAATDDNLTQVHRTKTDAEVFIPLPPAVAKMLRAHANDHPDYFFWNPERMKKTSLICQFGDWLRLVFDKAGVKHGQQEMLSHRFRHTFAVELLLADVPIEQVSKLLGHKTVRTAERYYSAWVKERQRKLEADVKQAWTKMELPDLFTSQLDAKALEGMALADAVIEGLIQ
jgi:integrase/recombinase XerD